MKLVKVTLQQLYNDVVLTEKRKLEELRKHPKDNEYETGSIFDQLCIYNDARAYFHDVLKQPVIARRKTG